MKRCYKSGFLLAGSAVMVLFAFFGAARAQSAAPQAGMVTRLTGNVTLSSSDGRKQPGQVQAFMKLQKNDQCEIPAGASLQIIYFTGGRQEIWKGPAAIKIGEGESQALSGGAPEIKVLPVMIAQKMANIPHRIDNASISRSGHLQLREAAKPEMIKPPVKLSDKEKQELQEALAGYKNLRQNAAPEDLTPESYLLGILIEYEQYREAAKVVAGMLAKEPGNKVLKNLQQWLRSQE